MDDILPNLDDCVEYEPTESCYLDGRYFDLVFALYPGYINTPLYIKLDVEEDRMYQEIILNNFEYKDNDINILRVIIETPKSRHSGVIIFDMIDKKGYYFDSSIFKYKNMILDIITRTFSFNQPVELIAPSIDLEINPNCKKSGFCVAYSIKFVYDYLLDRKYDPSYIRRFAACIESKFGPLDTENPDVEYGPGDTLLGAGAGALLGGTLLGPVGLLGGGLLGAGLGSNYGRNR